MSCQDDQPSGHFRIERWQFPTLRGKCVGINEKMAVCTSGRSLYGCLLRGGASDTPSLCADLTSYVSPWCLYTEQFKFIKAVSMCESYVLVLTGSEACILELKPEGWLLVSKRGFEFSEIGGCALGRGYFCVWKGKSLAVYRQFSLLHKKQFEDGIVHVGVGSDDELFVTTGGARHRTFVFAMTSMENKMIISSASENTVSVYRQGLQIGPTYVYQPSTGVLCRPCTSMIVDAVVDETAFVMHDKDYNLHIIHQDGEVFSIANDIIMQPHLNLKLKFDELAETYPSLHSAPEGIYLLLPECLCLIRFT